MNKYTIYHNPRCSKSRQTLQLLKEHDIEPTVVLYLDNPPNKTVLKQLLKKLDLSARDLLRSKETIYRELNLGDNTLDDEAIIAAMAIHPQLIERPIVVSGERAIIGRPPENVLGLIT